MCCLAHTLNTLDTSLYALTRPPIPIFVPTIYNFTYIIGGDIVHIYSVYSLYSLYALHHTYTATFLFLCFYAYNAHQYKITYSFKPHIFFQGIAAWQ